MVGATGLTSRLSIKPRQAIAVTQREYDGRNVTCRPAPFLVHANLPQVLINSEAAALYQSQIRRESDLEHRSGPILSFHCLAG